MDPLKTLPEDEFSKAILLRLARQLLGNVLPSQRGLTVGWKHTHDSVQLLAYFDRAPTETDRDAINEVAAQMEGEIGFSVSEKRFVIQVDPICLQSAQPFAQLEMLNYWAHFRYEDAAIQYPLPAFVNRLVAKSAVDNDLLLLAAQQALVGKIAAYTRKITAALVDNTLHLLAHTATADNAAQQTLLSAAAGEMTALFALPTTPIVRCVFAPGSYGDLETLAVTPYLRYDPEMGYFE